MEKPAFIAALSVCLACPAAAAPLIYIHDVLAKLGTVDATTGLVAVHGVMPTAMHDIAFDRRGELFGVSPTDAYVIDPEDGSAVIIGPHGIPTANALVFGPDGTLYAAGSGSSYLYEIDTTTGSAFAIGDIGFASAGDLAFSLGDLYMSATNDKLIKVDLMAGAAGQAVGPFGFIDVFGLATAANEAMYGVSGTQLLTVDSGTGAGAGLLDYGGQGIGGALGSAIIDEALRFNPGDANGDGAVNILDLSILSGNWQGTGVGGSFDGDFNADGIVNILDLSTLSANWQAMATVGESITLSGAAEAAVPEPGTLMLLAAGCVLLSRYSRLHARSRRAC